MVEQEKTPNVSFFLGDVHSGLPLPRRFLCKSRQIYESMIWLAAFILAQVSSIFIPPQFKTEACWSGQQQGSGRDSIVKNGEMMWKKNSI